MQGYVHDANIRLYRTLVAESEQNAKRDEGRHATLLTEEEAEKQKRESSVFADT
jgi:hypothetical protein